MALQYLAAGTALVFGVLLARALFRVVMGQAPSSDAPPAAAAPAPARRAPPTELKDFTVESIRPFTGEGGSPIYVAADGIVFDMSSHETGPAFYGPGGGYHAFAGRDASIGLATMEVSPDKCVKRTVDELSSAERETLGDWVQRFSMKYRIVGYLNDGAHPRTVAAGQAAAGGGR